MNEDLRWLAESVSEWRKGKNWACVHRDTVESEPSIFWSDFIEDDHKVNQFTRRNWQDARVQLGLEMSEEDEDRRMSNIARNRNGGFAYDAPPLELDEKSEAAARALNKMLDRNFVNPASIAERYPQYYKSVRHLEHVDVYQVHQLFEIEDPSGCIQHASKKLLLSGARTGGKPKCKDIEEARDTLTRWLEIQDEDEA